ncbi:putative ORFan [Tupanvirus deep ocean]|uniref:ORFan n=2 Tax=Tupanvirus TaxID=2094720 RepID=A0AC62AA24_9VIRU|nr:putative ORFan [Tupanvirus deep ocean]QKU34527.1 putative ORFan [Tupanvirus deep ocean]
MESLLHKTLKLLCPSDFANFANINIEFQNPEIIISVRGKKPYLNEILDYSYVRPEDYDCVPEKIKHKLVKVNSLHANYYTFDLTRYEEGNPYRITKNGQVFYKNCVICGSDRLTNNVFRNAWDSDNIIGRIDLKTCSKDRCTSIVHSHLFHYGAMSFFEYPPNIVTKYAINDLQTIVKMFYNQPRI